MFHRPSEKEKKSDPGLSPNRNFRRRIFLELRGLIILVFRQIYRSCPTARAATKAIRLAEILERSVRPYTAMYTFHKLDKRPISTEAVLRTNEPWQLGS